MPSARPLLPVAVCSTKDTAGLIYSFIGNVKRNSRPVMKKFPYRR
jgi:hypothetical protein